MKFATEIHVYILSLLLLSSTGQMECAAVPAQDSVFTVLCSPLPVPHCAAVTTSKLPPGPPPFPLNGEQLEQWAALPNNLTPKQLGYVKLLVVTYEEARKLEVETQQQAECPKWYELRFPRLTASSFGNICSKMAKPRAKPELVARDLLQPKPPSSFTDRMFKWGRENENIAVQVYRSIPQRSHVVLFECGIFISPEDPYLAATPDRVCYDATETIPWGIIEVKCPYNARDMTAAEAAKKIKNFMSTLKEDGTLALKVTHEYYYQVQGQMALTGAKWCDFIIYTKKGVSVQRICFDEQFWKAQVRLLSSFFLSYFLPKFIELKECPQR